MRSSRSPLSRRVRGVLLPGAAVLACTALVAASPVAAAVSGGTNGAASTAAQARVAAAAGNVQASRAGAGWLATQIIANGGYLAPFGAPDPANTATAVTALVATGTSKPAVDSAVAWLKTQVGSLGTPGVDDNAPALANLVLAATAAGQNPRAFGGTAPENNLVNRLRATQRSGGSDDGLYGSSDPTYDGAFRQGLALAALASVKAPAAQLTKGRAWLTRQQCADGLWTSYRADTTVPCPAADPATFSGPDTNSTGLAMQGLAATGGVTLKAKVLAALDAAQSADGGFAYIAAAGQDSDPNSTAVVIQGLVAVGGAPTSARFTVDGATPLDALRSFQLGCTDEAADRGAYFYPGSRTGNVLATIQAVPAQVRQAYPVAHRTLSATIPTVSCGSTPTPSSTSTTRPYAADAASAATAAASSPSARILAAAAKRAGTAGACKGTAGVTVAVDFKAFGQGTQVRCAPGDPATGIAALQGAGFTPAGTARYGLAFVCRINTLPAPAQDPCQNTPAASAYWAYYHASATATTWTYSTTGASTYNPAPGTIEAWAFGNGATPTLTPAKVRARTS